MDFRVLSGRFQQIVSLRNSFDGELYQFMEYIAKKFPDLFEFACDNYLLVKDYWENSK